MVLVPDNALSFNRLLGALLKKKPRAVSLNRCAAEDQAAAVLVKPRRDVHVIYLVCPMGFERICQGLSSQASVPTWSRRGPMSWRRLSASRGRLAAQFLSSRSLSFLEGQMATDVSQRVELRVADLTIRDT